MFVELEQINEEGTARGHVEKIDDVKRAHIVAYGTQTRLEITFTDKSIVSYDLARIVRFYVGEVTAS